MKLAVLGSTGRVGSVFVKMALACSRVPAHFHSIVPAARLGWGSMRGYTDEQQQQQQSQVQVGESRGVSHRRRRRERGDAFLPVLGDFFPFGGGRRDPFRRAMREMDRADRILSRDFDRVFPSEFDRMLSLVPAATELAATEWEPQVDISETKDAFIISAALPGVSKENVKIDVEGDTLAIRGERKEEKEQDDATVHMRESLYGSFMRTFVLPDNVDKKGIKANFKDGMLIITTPKTVSAETTTVEIE